MAAAGDFSVADPSIDGPERTNHIARAYDGYSSVCVAMPSPDRYVADLPRYMRIAAAADWHCGREEFWTALHDIPCSVSAHGNACRVDACGIDWKLGPNLVKKLDCEGHCFGRIRLHAVRDVRPRRIDPLLAVRHLSGEEVPFDAAFAHMAEKGFCAPEKLADVVCAALASAVEEYNERIAFARLDLRGFGPAVAEDLAGCVSVYLWNGPAGSRLHGAGDRRGRGANGCV